MKVVVARMNIKQGLQRRYLHLIDCLRTLAKFISARLMQVLKGLTLSPPRPISWGLIFFSVYIVLRYIAIIALMLELASILLPFTGPGVEVVIELMFYTLVTFGLKSMFYKK